MKVTYKDVSSWFKAADENDLRAVVRLLTQRIEELESGSVLGMLLQYSGQSLDLILHRKEVALLKSTYELNDLKEAKE